MFKKSAMTIAVAGALLAAGQLAFANHAQADIAADLRALVANPSKNLDSLLDSKELKSFTKELENGDGSVMKRLKDRCASLKKTNNWNVNCDW